MRLTGVIQNHNGIEGGHLERALTSLSKTTDHLVVYDDASTENVRPLYEAFDATVIYGLENNFCRELYHKQALLDVALRTNPDWLVWIDSDAILGRYFADKERTVSMLEEVDKAGNVMVFLHNRNLWRSLRWARTDSQFDDLWHGVFWKNTGQLHYNPIGKLHQKQYPLFYTDQEKQVLATKFENPLGQLLHYGFADPLDIAQKYYRYKKHGQIGYPLNRLVTEKEITPEGLTGKPMTFEEMEADQFPDFCSDDVLLNTDDPPTELLSVEMMEQYATYEDWLKEFLEE